ncbi:MAG: hypothetical protein ACRDI0_04655 [Actinomycetota bacterium]
MADRRFRFTVLGRYPARLRQNQTAVTVSMAAGEGDHLVHCGTLTMAEAEWDDFAAALGRAFRDGVEVVDADATS